MSQDKQIKCVILDDGDGKYLAAENVPSDSSRTELKRLLGQYADSFIDGGYGDEIEIVLYVRFLTQAQIDAMVES